MTDIDPAYVTCATIVVLIADVAAVVMKKITPHAFWRNLIVLYIGITLLVAAQQKWSAAIAHLVIIGVYTFFYRLVRPVVHPAWWNGQHERIDNP